MYTYTYIHTCACVYVSYRCLSFMSVGIKYPDVKQPQDKGLLAVESQVPGSVSGESRRELEASSHISSESGARVNAGMLVAQTAFPGLVQLKAQNREWYRPRGARSPHIS